MEVTLPQMDVLTPLQEQASERLLQCGSANDHMSRKRRARDSPIQVDDQVLIKNKRPGGKFRPPFELMPWTVVRIRGTMLNAVKDQEQVTRNISFFKHRSEGHGVEEDTSTPPPGGESAEAGMTTLTFWSRGHNPPRRWPRRYSAPSLRYDGHQEGDSQSPPLRPNGNAGTLMNDFPCAGTERYHLRPKPVRPAS
ncbi:hypothetical protein NDU88_007347 [Pleurodeles waltl]|uniref:Uncharacterized protein n=1 Tax=Pleurodeles waltl TaxID=8319 RepID=A0AAV7NTC9_PLEWA|nr:hypothetical protein NDU88_007347 [Pleurodeles waltl]